MTVWHFARLVDDLLIPMSNSPMQALCWSLLLLAEKSQIQRRVQSELDSAIGLPLRADLSIQSTIEKRSNLTYSMATFWEVCLIKFRSIEQSPCRYLIEYLVYLFLQVQRFGSWIVTTFARRVKEPVLVRDCKVPNNSLLSINFWAINRDPMQWEKPAEFWPEHFYGKNEQGVPCVKNLDRLLPFSIGDPCCSQIPRNLFYKIMCKILSLQVRARAQCAVFPRRYCRRFFSLRFTGSLQSPGLSGPQLPMPTSLWTASLARSLYVSLCVQSRSPRKPID